MVLPEAFQNIGIHAFLACGFSDIVIPESVTSIGEEALELCTNLNRAHVPAQVSELTELAFSECASLEGIDVDAANPNYRSIDRVLYPKDMKTLMSLPGGKGGGFTF